MKQVQHIMDKYLMTKRTILAFLTLLPVFLSGCVTQHYENDETPVVENQANRDDMAATRVSLGLGYLKMGNMPQAKQNLEKAKNFAPDMVQVYTAFAHYYETVGEHALTIESYEKALSIKSDDADTLNNYGVYLCRQDKIEAAEKQLLKAIAVPSYILVSKSYENLASCFLQKDDFAKTEMYLNKAILHSPSSSSILFQMVQLQYAMGDYQEAKKFEQRFSKVTRRFTSQSLALSYKVHYKLGQRKTAKNYGSMLVKMYPQSWEAQQYLLNELELIEADNLAKRYKLSQVTNSDGKSKKRIVKLSPKKSSAKVTEPKVTTQAPKKVQAEKEADKTHLAAPAATTELIVISAEKKVITKSPVKESKVEQHSSVKNMPEIDEPKVIKDENSTVITTPENVKVIDAPLETVATEASKKAKEESEPSKKVQHENILDFHVVEAGDTLYSISVRYNIKLKALRQWNNIDKNKKLHIKDVIFLEDPTLVKQ